MDPNAVVSGLAIADRGRHLIQLETRMAYAGLRSYSLTTCPPTPRTSIFNMSDATAEVSETPALPLGFLRASVLVVSDAPRLVSGRSRAPSARAKPTLELVTCHRSGSYSK